jgi:hypothetical protein
MNFKKWMCQQGQARCAERFANPIRPIQLLIMMFLILSKNGQINMQFHRPDTQVLFCWAISLVGNACCLCGQQQFLPINDYN